MSRLACPFCGPRELEEFFFRKTLPEPGATACAAVYERVNNLHESTEHWQHLHGCRAWLWVRRDPSNNRILDVRLLGSQVIS